MNRRVVPIFDARATPLPVVGEQPGDSASMVADQRGRHMTDLRISVTDRCNFRCQYCMPRAVFDSNYKFLPQKALLDFDEITRLAQLFVAQGVRKLRLTGGEPLLRRNLEALIEKLARLRTPEGDAVEVTLTTNASLLAKKATALKAAGLTRVTVSLDALDDTIFRRMNDADFAVADVLAGIDEAARVGLGPIKINMVVQRGVNDGEIDAMVTRFRGTHHIVRFIEYMDVGTTNGWALDQVVPTSELLARVNQRFPIEPVAASYPGEVAARWRYLDGRGEIGVITSVSQPFCGDCTRARLSTEGKLYTCLFATRGTDLRELVRTGGSDLALTAAIRSIWHARNDHYSEIRTAETSQARKKVEMSYIGG